MYMSNCRLVHISFAQFGARSINVACPEILLFSFTRLLYGQLTVGKHIFLLLVQRLHDIKIKIKA